ncbi:MAG: serine hydrolase domain-containing protein [Brevinematales bacterium]|jgi:CubicO group peptidase (beta-lactamase class C family)
MIYRSLKLPVILRFVLLIFSILFASSCGNYDIKAHKIVKYDCSGVIRFLDTKIRDSMKEYNITAIGLAIVVDNNTVFMTNYGVMNRESDTPIPPDAYFQPGSITKSFTALAVMKLSEEGKIDIDAPLTNYLAGFVMKSRFTNKSPITIRQLLSHRAGLPRDFEYKAGPGFLAALKSEYLISPPGETFRYSNLGFQLLGMVIEEVSGMKYEDYMKRYILDPLGMSESSFTKTPAISSRLVQTYSGNTAYSQPDIINKPAGNLYVTTHGMANYIKFLLSDKENKSNCIIDADSFNEMTSPQFTNTEFFIEAKGGEYPYGLGWMIENWPGTGRYKIIKHGGDVNGFNSEIYFIPELKLGMVIMESSMAYEPLINLEDIRYETMKRLIEMRTGESISLDKTSEKTYMPDNDRSVNEDLTDFTGLYAGNGIVWSIYSKGNELLAREANDKVSLLKQVGNNTFFVQKTQNNPFILGTYLYCIRTASGREEIIVRMVNRHGGIYEMPLEKVIPYTIRENMKRYEGKWRIIKDPAGKCYMKEITATNVAFDIAAKNGFLEIAMGKRTLVLEPLNETEAIEAGEGSTWFFSRDEIRNNGLRFERYE